ncbi:MAG: DUF983 domain-containing protein [Alphaproteobacteria bacterium]|nr:DUF983 domain-containing protein [Alphaproteobacteria bacterium]
MPAAAPAPVSLLSVVLRCRCPRCGEGRLFDGLLKVMPYCAHCGLDLRAEDAGDGPAVLVMFMLGALVVAGALLVEIAFAPPLWVHIALWTPVTIGGGIALLRPFKATLIAQQYRHRALGGGPTTP